uniref:Uncharacterized protein n=1 Tax=Attheya septentrionalis TaxID=420275 RepID=A0A7S2UIA5_9STRA|mmetsp:Transcript_26776/g.48629  ORF Transcript_26776/g.48629 Transcript_26776/m.48629 type:complete len:232 (+) Transcript_26776:201-896(+)|eukprot:CAMPEP_0198303158 /NCGR_PEP_ID=MMETSP1449-20131203/56744_1 /TAXON_ID=420275 /ORGANISM="Attheya septentrionalis, Strain CCMP2084" /LENGTH=231 /DNA_ID=CAMNT_0044005643 /DNA_START=485 /DNA_END=1180 /DNA_ORIENTATION=-
MSGAMVAFLVMTVAILFCQVCSYCDAVAPSSSLAFLPNKARVMHNTARLFELRGGDDDDDDDMSEDENEYDLDASSEEVEEEEPVVVALKKKVKTTRKKSHAKQSKLSESTKAATKKATAKKTAESKKAVSVTMSMTSNKPNKSKKKSSSSMIRIPYILKACLNPLTVFAMTRAYFASLFNINYLEQDSSQTLRSALQEKAKQNDGATKKRKRAMKPGQAKTLSDLPQLSA